MCPTMTVSLRRHNSGMALWKAAPEEARLEATACERQPEMVPT